MQAAVTLRVNITAGSLRSPWSLRLTNPHYAGILHSYNWQIRTAAAGVVSGGSPAASALGAASPAHAA